MVQNLFLLSRALFQRLFHFLLLFLFFHALLACLLGGGLLLLAGLLLAERGLTLLLAELSDELGVLSLLCGTGGNVALLQGEAAALVLEHAGGDQALDLRRLGGVLLAFLALDNLAVDKGANVLVLSEGAGLADVVGALGGAGRGLVAIGISQASEVSGATLGDDEGEDRQVVGNNAATDRLAAALTLAVGVEVAGRWEGSERKKGEKAEKGGKDVEHAPARIQLLVAGGKAKRRARRT